MRTLVWCSVVGATFALLGCSTSAPLAPAGPSAANDFDFPTIGQGEGVTSVAGHWRLHIDPVTMTGHAEPVLHREAATIGDGFKLPINQFFNAFGGGFSLDALGITGSDIAITYSITHPFAAPADLGGAPTATNRADLGVSGWTTFLAPVNLGTKGATPADADYVGDYTFTIGGDTYTANTKVVKNAAGYIKPNDFALPGVDTGDANTFPYLPLVDESLNARTNTATGAAIDNGIGGGSPDGSGNYNAAAGGWQAANIGAGNAGWTGFGKLHQGQTATDTVIVDPDLGEGGEFTLDVVVIAKYIDPRSNIGIQPRFNRLPSGAANFRYHEPYGAVDMEKIVAGGDLDLDITGGDTEVTIELAITDMDANATVDADALTDSADTGKIPSASGVGSLLGSSSELGVSDASGTDTAAGTGTHDDPLMWELVVPNTAGLTDGGSDGLAYVMLRIQDEEFGATDAFFSVGHELVPAPVANGMDNETLQVVVITVTP